MNKMLEMLVYYSGGVINAFSTAFLLQCVISAINGKRYGFKKIIISWLIFIPTALIAQFIQEYLKDFLWVKALLMLLNIYAVSCIYYKTKYLKCLLTTFLTLICICILDGLVTVFLTFIKLDIKVLALNKYFYTFVILLSSFMQIVTGLLFKFIFYDKKKVEAEILEANSKYIIPPFLALVICLLLSFMTLAFNKYEYGIYFVLINIFQITAVSFVGIYNLNRFIKQKITERDFENTKLYNKSLITINEEVIGMKHDMSNIVQSINGYLTLKDYEGAIKYCNHLLNDFSNVNLLSVLSPDIIDEPAIYGIIARKKYIAEEKGINLDVAVTCSCKNICFPLFELTRSIGILLDNAIEATLETKEKELWIDIKYDYNLNSHIITIGNSVKDPNKINISKIFNYGYSTKKVPSGIGLFEIVRFMDKYNLGYIKPEINFEKKLFIQEMTFKIVENYELINK